MDTLGPLNACGLILLGAALLWTVRLVYGARDQRGEDLLWRLLVVTGWLLLLAGFLGVLTGFLGWYSILIWLALLAVMFMAFGKYEDAERKSLLWVLAVAADRGIPLGAAVRSLAAERSVGRGRRARYLADLLDQGVPLCDALDLSRNPLPMDALLAARFGTRSGRLGPALKQVVEQTDSYEATIRSLIEKTLYVILITLVTLTVIIFFSIFVSPRYSMLMASFGVALGDLSQLAFDACDALAMVWPVWVPIFVGLLSVGVVCLLYYVGWLNTDLPFLGWLWQRHDSALLMRCLALAMRERQPLLSALVVLSDEFPRKRVRRRLRRAVRQVNHGNHWCDSLWKAGLLRRYELAVLKSAEVAGNLAWALDEMSDSAMRRMTLRLQTAIGWIVPPLFVMFGLFAGLLAVGMLLPLAQLIQALA